MTTRSESILPEFYLDGPETPTEQVRAAAAHKRYINERFKQGQLPHINPGSTLIAAMGAHWHDGCFEAVYNMAKHTICEGGRLVRFYSEQDRCYERYDALGIMRNLAYMRALREGFEYIMYVDNDVQPEPDALIRLQEWRCPIIAPRLEFTDGRDYKFIQQHIEKNVGLAIPPSVLLSVMLFRVEVFMPWYSGGFWDNPRGADEEYHFLRLASLGHRPFIATDVTVKVTNAPHFPFDHIKRTAGDLAPQDTIEREKAERARA